MNIRFCKKCLYPETKPDLFFNENGICSACLAAEEKNIGINWTEREKEFLKIVDYYK